MKHKYLSIGLILSFFISSLSYADVAAVLTPWPEFIETPWHDWLSDGYTILNFWE